MNQTNSTKNKHHCLFLINALCEKMLNWIPNSGASIRSHILFLWIDFTLFAACSSSRLNSFVWAINWLIWFDKPRWITKVYLVLLATIAQWLNAGPFESYLKGNFCKYHQCKCMKLALQRLTNKLRMLLTYHSAA